MRDVKGTLVRDASDKGAIEWAAGILRSGGLVAFPTETVYGLGADGLNGEAVARIFEAKGRPADNPLILHLWGYDALNQVVSEVPSEARVLAEAFWPGPLTFILKKNDLVPDAVSAGLSTVAVRCPDHPVALALLRAVGRPLAAPSANLSGRPSPTTAGDVLEDLAGRIEAVLDGGPTTHGIESTVIDLTVSPPVLLRPGAVPPEVLRKYLPGLVLAKGVLPELSGGEGGKGDDARPASPGMKYRHYSPRAQLILVRGEPEKIPLRVRELAQDLSGMRVAFLVTEETMVELSGMVNGELVNVGQRNKPEGIAAGLYRILREVDRTGVDVIIAEGIPLNGWGVAVMDRLLRAANGVVEA